MYLWTDLHIQSFIHQLQFQNPFLFFDFVDNECLIVALQAAFVT